MNRLLLFANMIILILLLSFPASGADAPLAVKPADLSLEQALGFMREGNESLYAARLEEDQRKSEKKAAAGLYLPKVETKANAIQMSDPIVMDLNDIRTAILEVQKGTLKAQGMSDPMIAAVSAQTDASLPSFEKTLVEDRFFKIDASVTWTIFTGGKIKAANGAAGARVKESHEKYSDTWNKLTTELINRYFGLCLASKVVDVRKMVLDGMKKHLDEAKALEKNGMIAQVERLHAEVAYSEALREYQRSQRTVSLARMLLANTISRKDDYSLTTPLFVLNSIEPLEHFISSAMEKNPLLKQLQANRELAHQGYVKERAAFSPDIFLFANKEVYGYHTPEYSPNWMVGAGLSYTIFEGLSGYHKTDAAKSQEARIAVMEKKARKDIAALVEKNYQELMLAYEQYSSIKASYAFAQEYLRVREKAFADGAATSLDVVDAELSFAKVKIDRLKAMYDYTTALAALFEVSGKSGMYEQYMKSKEAEVEF